MNKNAVVIGAGQTGRGYAARYLYEKGYNITFIDINKELIHFLVTDASFAIHFYHKDRTPLQINNFKAFHNSDVEVRNEIHAADLIITSTGEQNLVDIAPMIAEGLADKNKETVFITAENGTNPAKVLRSHLEEQQIKVPYTVSQTAVFCSTVSINDTRLDILSQNETYFPYDHDELKNLDFHGAVPVRNFEDFFERKIYTYNCLAGLISYCGYVKGYEVYGEAANDKEVSKAMDVLLESLNPALAKYFDISEEEQNAFSVKALNKFKDRKILDYTVKNGRAPKRKLGPTERIVAPINIIKKYGGDTYILEFVAAAALVYWKDREGNGEPAIEGDIKEVFSEVTGFSSDSTVTTNVFKYYNEIMNDRENVKIFDILEK